jgi:hypothetical protein
MEMRQAGPAKGQVECGATAMICLKDDKTLSETDKTYATVA